LLIFNFCFLSLVQADGFIIIPDPPQNNTKDLSVKYHYVDVEISSSVARVVIDQVFINHNDFMIEGQYLFPLPAGASISDFELEVDEEIIKGEILSAEEARLIYEDNVRKMLKPGLLEYTEQDLFQASINNISPLGERRVKISYSQIINRSESLHQFIYPLSTEKWSKEDLEEVVIKVNLQTEEELKNIFSPTHKIEVIKESSQRALISFQAKNVKPDKDFELFYSLDSKNKIGTSLTTYKKGEEGFFLFLASPSLEEKNLEIMPKEITFVVDTSGSMAGEKIIQAGKALEFFINRLNANDSFKIVRFSTEIETFPTKGFADITQLSTAKEFIENFEAIGGTNISGALSEALSKSGQTDKLDMIVFLTDGEPTVGETNFDELISLTQKNNKNNTRIFVFGVGFDVNTHLLDKISSYSRAFSIYVAEDENLEIPLSNFAKKISKPVLSNLELNFTGSEAKEIFPKILPDLFFGDQLVILGKFTQSGNFEVSLKGETNEGKVEFSNNFSFPEKDLKNDFIPFLWASRKIGYLLDEVRLNGESEELIDSIVTLSKKYGLITPFTSFLVRDDQNIEKNDNKLLEEALDSMNFDADTGESAQNMAKQTRSLQESEKSFSSVENESGQVLVKIVKGRTFFLKNNIWQESSFEKQATKKIAYLSNEYFQLTKDFGAFLALGKKVIFKNENNEFIEIVESDEDLPSKEDGNVENNSCAQAGENFSKVFTDDYPQNCCENLTEWESGFDSRIVKDGQCVETDLLKGSPIGICLNCGNGHCEEIENICNCPLDCSLEDEDQEELLPGVFKDTKEHWCKEFVIDLMDKGIVKGFDDNTFRPANPVKRSEALKMVMIARDEEIENEVKAEEIKFIDVEVDDWFTPFVQKALKENIIIENENKIFRPSEEATRIEILQMLLANDPDLSESNNEINFPDLTPDEVKFVGLAFKKGIVKGFTDGTFRPNEKVTRGQMAKIISVFLKQPEENSQIIKSINAPTFDDFLE